MTSHIGIVQFAGSVMRSQYYRESRYK